MKITDCRDCLYHFAKFKLHPSGAGIGLKLVEECLQSIQIWIQPDWTALGSNRPDRTGQNWTSGKDKTCLIWRSESG